ncbi:hypothetical protein AVEN_189183-1 [Araneus ventricosus]|uniref:Uncharacterized protein n=1 Tax=Araneus ventricosus TaxID=182803 RepID=A0A4Y1ZNK3_ARAVE|nr:hypothetical protein AVEN_189183-1 [Araneus ventricosus]
MIAESCLELPESTLVKSWQKIWLSNQIGEEEAVVSTEISTANFLSAFKDLDGCQDVFAEDVEWSNGWPLTRISSKRFCRLKTSSGLSQMGFKMIIMAMTSLKIPHPSYGWNESFRSGIMLCGAAVISFPH